MKGTYKLLVNDTSTSLESLGSVSVGTLGALSQCIEQRPLVGTSTYARQLQNAPARLRGGSQMNFGRERKP